METPNGRLAIYYGGADTVVCLAFGYIDELIDFVKKNSETAALPAQPSARGREQRPSRSSSRL